MQEDSTENFGPATTALIIIGASEFRHRDEDPLKPAFKLSKDKIKTFFQDPRLGFGLSDDRIHEDFDTDHTPDAVEGGVNEFIEKRGINDLFVYICSHGTKERLSNRPCVELSLTDPKQIGRTALDFFTFAKNLNYSGRAYFIVDCCYSGLVHATNENNWVRITDKDRGFIDAVDVANWPTEGRTFLTSNAPSVPGVVIARDDLPNIKTTLCTHVLENVLRKGIRDRKLALGFGFLDLAREISTQLEATVEQENADIRERNKNRAEDSQIQLVKMASSWEKPGLSDDYVLGSRLLSRVGVFQNNYFRHIDVLHEGIRNADEVLQGLRRACAGQEREIEKLNGYLRNRERRIRDLNHDQQQKERRIRGLNEDHRKTERRIRELKADHRGSERRIRELHEDNWKKERGMRQLTKDLWEREAAIQELAESNRKSEETARALAARNRELDSAFTTARLRLSVMVVLVLAVSFALVLVQALK